MTRMASGVKAMGGLLRASIQKSPKLEFKARFNSSLHPELCAGITSIGLDGVPPPDAVRRLWDGYKIRVRDVGEPYGLRISTAAYTQESEISELVGRMGDMC